MLSAADIKAALRKRFDPQAFALMFEVANATGANHSRWADAVAVGLWPSRGLTIQGFEIKVSRNDWLKELKEPAKAEPICRFCHQWWIVAGDAKIVKSEELPPAWGLMVMTGRGLTISKAAPPKTPEPISAAFLAALMRSAAKPDVAAQQVAIMQARQAGREEAIDQANREVAMIRKSRDELEQRVAAFEQASGVNIRAHWGGWGNPQRTGEVVKQVLNGEHDRDLGQVKRIRDIASSLVESIDASGVLQEVARA